MRKQFFVMDLCDESETSLNLSELLSMYAERVRTMGYNGQAPRFSVVTYDTFAGYANVDSVDPFTGRIIPRA